MRSIHAWIVLHIQYERRTNMKRVDLWMIGIGLSLSVGLLTVAQGYAECTLATLSGTYVFTATGYNITSSGPQPKAIVEVIDFNGDGTLNVPAATVSLNGNTPLRSKDVGGSYTVPNTNFSDDSESCTGTITFNIGPTLDIFIAPNGKEFYLIQTNPNTVLAGVARRVSHDHE